MNKIIKDSISSIRVLSCDMINKANSGHPGIALGIAPAAFTLFSSFINLNPKNSKWYDRDRFVLSAGHGSALLYSILHLSGFNISINDLKQFRQFGSKTPGHPESVLTEGVEVTTGPLGQGIGMAVGMALSETIESKKFNKPELKIVDHYTYVISSDGDLQEGCSYESISLAGHWKLNKLIVLYDSNDIQLDSSVSFSQSEDTKKRFESAGWNYLLVKNGNNIDEISSAIRSAKKSLFKPTLIEVKTIIGFGASKQGTSEVHGSPLGNDIDVLRENLDFNHPPFTIPKDVYKYFNENVKLRGMKKFDLWSQDLKKYQKLYPIDYDNYMIMYDKKRKTSFHNETNFDAIKNLIPKENQATRLSSGIILSQLHSFLPNLICGSADLSSSTKVVGPNGTYHHTNRLGQNLAFGVREFAMAAIANGISAHSNFLPCVSTFLVFADYLKPAMRLTSLMQLPALFVFTHDSILIGEDGATHQPIEQIVMLRAQPNLFVFRPADFRETIAAYKYAIIKNLNIPNVIILTRQELPQLSTSSLENSMFGAYIITHKKNAKITIIATGSEVNLAIQIQQILFDKHKISINVVSMLCQELFDIQSDEYKESILPNNHLKISLEFNSTFGWSKYTSRSGLNIGYDIFGISAPKKNIISKLKLDVNSIVLKILNFISE